MPDVYLEYARQEARKILDLLETRAEINRHSGDMDDLVLRFKWMEVLPLIDRQRLNFTWNDAVGNVFLCQLASNPLAKVWFDRTEFSYTIHYRVRSTIHEFDTLSALKNS